MTKKEAVLDNVDIADLKTAGPISGDNGVEPVFNDSEYAVEVALEGRAPLLFHRYDTQAVKEKGEAKKGSNEKKTDNIQSYTHRDSDGYLSVPAVAIWACLGEAARSMRDPRSPRKALRDLARAGLRVEPFMVPILPKTKEWHYIDRQRVVVQRAAITRERPAIKEGWKLKFNLIVLAGEYLNEDLVHDLVYRSGRYVGLLDGRPLYGLFRVTGFKRVKLED